MATFDRKEDYLYVRWADAVKKRDHYCCQICGERGNLNSHHLNGWNAFPDQRYDIENGICLCGGNILSCHERFHAIYGKGDNTEEQFKEFEKFCQLLLKTSKNKNVRKVYSENILQKLQKDLDGYEQI